MCSSDLRTLGGSCQVPLAAYAVLDGDNVELRALVASPDGKQVIHFQQTGPVAQAEQIGEAVAQALLSKGAAAILAALQDTSAV